MTEPSSSSIENWSNVFVQNKERFLEAVSFITTNALVSETFYRQTFNDPHTPRASKWTQRTYPAIAEHLRITHASYNHLLDCVAELPNLPLYDVETYTLLPKKIEERMKNEPVTHPTKQNLSQFIITPFHQRNVQEAWLGQLFRLIEARALLEDQPQSTRKKLLASTDPFHPHNPVQEWVYVITEDIPRLKRTMEKYIETTPSHLPTSIDAEHFLKNIYRTHIHLQTMLTEWNERESHNPDNNNTYLSREALQTWVLNEGIWLNSDIELRRLGFDYNLETNQIEEKSP